VTVPSPASPLRARRHAGLLARVLIVPVLAATLVLGVWVAGGVVTNDFRASMALTALWLALTGLAAVVAAVRRRDLRVPVLGTYVVVAGVVGGYLALTTLRDHVVHEKVVVAAPAGGRTPQDATRPAPMNVELARGRFRSAEHTTTGRAAVVRLPGGRRYLTLTSLDTSAGPDLRVRLVPGDTLDGTASGNVDLGALKGNRGDQQYEIPRGAAVAGRSVVIWCRAFSAPFGSAVLRAS
jgi:hypothetical protein